MNALEAEGLNTYYGKSHILHDVGLVVAEGRHACPFWIFGTLKCDQIYGNIEEVIAEIKQMMVKRKA